MGPALIIPLRVPDEESRAAANPFARNSSTCSNAHSAGGAIEKALNGLREAVQEMDAALEETRAEHDPLALHIFVSRRRYQKMEDSKSGKRHEREAWASYHRASDLGFRGRFDEWQRLLGAVTRR